MNGVGILHVACLPVDVVGNVSCVMRHAMPCHAMPCYDFTTDSSVISTSCISEVTHMAGALALLGPIGMALVHRWATRRVTKIVWVCYVMSCHHHVM